ncbi:MAG: hypothetical protein Q9204_001210 [Flavoplaca sp. TL-2023a]
MEEFAQTREPDNLFDDDFTPLAETEPVIEQPFQSSALQPHSLVSSHSRGWGRDRSNHQQRTRSIPQPAVPTQVVTASSTVEPDVTEQSAAPKTTSAVRGDRSATGGNAKPKLTEEELSARLAAAKLNSQKREEAHRLAEADEASFQQREAQASQRRQEEGRARRVMDQEREKNRLRKLGAQGGREWDEGKGDQPVDPRRVEYRMEPHGGTSNYQGSEARGGNLQIDGDYNDADRGGGRGRGGYDSSAGGLEIMKPAAPNIEKDFPALPSAATQKSMTDTSHHQTKGEQQPQMEVPKFQAPLGGGESWADEVAGKGL